ncbi:CCA tRNA nucleotidyltransferase [Sphingomonas bacterium]|uniref:CCA tRNA nucleotidyltransferase n=1 Tax=Sphingomonas bacterium TaxID=1895847 RepID=UPI00260ED5FD|nr:CCA tRNA nucleotidyltransferase [Sphingomonas bacterium]MDB5679462.1 polynucleotide adenylyltransferase [Sphingomonas bacterium]
MGGVTLPPAAWRDRAGLARVIDALGSGTARIVGGAVRDTLLGIDTADVDLATTHAPETVVDLLEAARIKAVPTGIKHGTITAVASDEVYEVTTLRRDLETDGRHATVAFTDDWREDAARRDFTINALYADPASGEIFDYFGGIDDLAARRVRFIGDPLTRIAEDHLRILRFFRFLARFGDVADVEGLKACADRANDLMALSRERIANELLRLLVAPRAPEVVASMVEHGIFVPVLPEIVDVLQLAALARREDEAGIAPDPIRRLAAILPSNAATVATIGARLKLSKLQRRRLESAAEPVDMEPRALAYRLGTEFAVDRLLLAGDSLGDLDGWTPPALPLSGGALVAKGLTAGPDVARTLHRVEDRWIAEGFPDAARVAEIADEEVAQVLADIRKS